MGLFKRKNVEMTVLDFLGSAVEDLNIQEAAFSTCENLVANALAKCELRTYKGGKFEKGEMWYRFNVQPNPNQNATEFWQKLVHRLYEDNEALIVIRKVGLFSIEFYVADSFIKDDTQAFNEHAYKNIVINGYNYPPTLLESQVIYLKLHAKNVKKLTDGIANKYAEIITSFINWYKNSVSQKGILYIRRLNERNGQDNANKAVQSFKKFFEAQNAVMPLFDGYKYESLTNNTQPGSDTRDLTNQIKDVFEQYATAFGIPKILITGDVVDTKQAVQYLLTFCIDPLTELIADEINRKIYSQKDFLAGTYAKWQTNAIQHIDMMDVASNIEKLISSGYICIDDLRELSGLDPVNEEWSKQYFMTKNFSTIEELLTNENTEPDTIRADTSRRE